MRAIAAMLRATWLSASSYKVSTILSMLAMLISVVPVYFIARELQRTMSAAIANEGGNFFGFVLLGMIGMMVVTEAIYGLASTVGATATSGTLDALMLTPTSLPVLFIGLNAYSLLLLLVRVGIFLAAGAILGAPLIWYKVPEGLLVLVLILLAYMPIGMVGTALLLTFRTQAQLPSAAVVGSALLGGVYYPTHVIPSWLENLSLVVPLSYGLRAFRRIMLEGSSLLGEWNEILPLIGFIVVLGTLGTMAMMWALSYARREGTLTQY